MRCRTGHPTRWRHTAPPCRCGPTLWRDRAAAVRAEWSQMANPAAARKEELPSYSEPCHADGALGKFGQGSKSAGFKCADEDGLLGVVKPETCAYVAIFGSASAYTTDSVRAAHAELAAAAAAAGLPYEPDAAVKTLLGL